MTSVSGVISKDKKTISNCPIITVWLIFLGGIVTGRGCSTKDKIFHIECENHVMGAKSEKFCYCSYFLCNRGDSRHRSHDWTLTVIATTLPLLFNIHWTSS